MKTNVFIRSASSIETKSNEQGEITNCTVSVLVSDPDQLIKVGLTPDQLKCGGVSYLSSIVGKEIELNVYEQSDTFRDRTTDKLKEFSIWRFYNLPLGFPTQSSSPASTNNSQPVEKVKL